MAPSFSWRWKLNQVALAEQKIKISIILRALAKAEAKTSIFCLLG